MRNELNDIEKIERYLKNQMSAEEKISFENEMNDIPALKKSVEEQKELLKGMERMKMKKSISSAKFKYKLMKGAVNIGIPVLITAIATALILNYSSKKVASSTSATEEKTITEYNLPELNETGDSLWADADKYIPYQMYSLESNRDTVIVGKDGTILSIPANSFIDENGNPVKGKIDFELKEAVTTENILKGGLSTFSNDELLETGGMFYINARQNGKSLKIAEGKNIYADVPSDPNKPGMLLFDGERKADGSINWINPKPIEKPLVAVDIHSLNFYPPKYEDSLAAMGKDVSNKKYKDSLYYSFAGKFGKDDWKAIDIKYVKKETESATNRTQMAEISKIEIPKIKWSYKVIQGNNYDEYKIEIYGEIENEWFIFSKNQTNLDGPIPLKLNLEKSINYKVISEFKELNKSESKYFEGFNGNFNILRGKNTFTFTIKVKTEKDFYLEGELEFMVCGEKLVYPPSYYKFKPLVKGVKGIGIPTNNIDSISTFSGLNPAKVKSIWNDKFQNTLIATKEFEERIPYIHQLCSRGNNVLDIYVKNIDQKMCTIDSMVANTLSGSDKERFLKFAARGEGKVKTEDNCLKKLSEFYEKQIKLETEAAKKTRDLYYQKNEEANTNATSKIQKHTAKDLQRESENLNREFTINLQDAKRQLGFVETRGRVRVSVVTTGWKNVDRYVWDATVNRETMNYTDPYTGKTAVLKYEPVTIKIENEESYDHVLVYLLPDQLNSFMRVKKEDGIYKEKLNLLFKHELVVIAYKGEKAYFKYLNEIKENENYEIALTEISEKDLNAQLGNLKKMQHADEMKKDVAHQYFLLADAKRRKAFLEKEKFIRRIEKVIFPCGNGVEETIPVVAPVSENYFQEY